MALEQIDMAALKRNLARLQGGPAPRRSNWWYPKVKGDTYTFRIVPFPGTGGLPYLYRKVYRNINGWRPIVAPYQEPFSQPDPVQETITELQQRQKTATGAEREEVDRLLKELYPRDYFYVMGVDRDDEVPSLKLWTVNKMTLEDIMELGLNEDYEGLFDWHSGRDLRIVKGEKGKHSITPRPQQTPVAATEEEMHKMIQEAPHPDNVDRPLPYDEIQKMLNSWLSNGGEYNDSLPTASSGSSAAAPSEADKIANSLSEAFS